MHKIKNNCELITHVGSWNWYPRGRNARLEVFSSCNTEWRQWSGDWVLLKKILRNTI